MPNGVPMTEQSENISQQENEDLAQSSMDEMGEPEQATDEVVNAEEPHKDPMADLPAFAKQRLGRQEKRHQREMREMREHIAQLAQQSQPQGPASNMNQMQMPQQDPHSQDIHQAVAKALNDRDQAEKARHVHEQYQNLDDKLNSTADKYDDFDDVVRNDKVPFTASMRDAALLLDNPGEVLYKLAKDPKKLKEIGKLHPLDQAKEMVKLSHSLMTNGGRAASATSAPIGQVKNSPIPSNAITDKTPASEIRARMKSGNWK